MKNNYLCSFLNNSDLFVGRKLYYLMLYFCKVRNNSFDQGSKIISKPFFITYNCLERLSFVIES